MNSSGKKNRIGTVFTLIAVLLILTMTTLNLPLLYPIRQFLSGTVSFEEMKGGVSYLLTGNESPMKLSFIDLNGLFARVSGRRVYNDVALMKNGMLATVEGEREDMSDAVEGYIRCSSWLQEKGIPFLFVQAPYKVPMEEDLLPRGCENFCNENANMLTEGLREAGVEVLDLRPDFSRDGEQIARYFYRTDHHWTADGALPACQLLLDRMETLMGRSFERNNLEISRWERHSVENMFLGSQGRRVGALYAGTDPVIWYTPKFETEMSCEVPHKDQVFEGDFAEANLRLQYTENRDLYALDNYAVFVGGNYPLVKHRNQQAPNQIRLLLINDSFTLPVECFLSTVFSEIDVLDPRYYDECSVAEYIERMDPDFVAVMTTANLDHDVSYFSWADGLS